MPKILTAGEIIAAKDRTTKEVEVPEWGGSVLLRELSAADSGWLSSKFITEEIVDGPVKNGKPTKEVRQTVDKEKMLPALLSRAIVGEDGNPIFDENELHLIGAKSRQVVERLALVVNKMSGMNLDSLEEAEKNSVGVSSADSSTVSPSPSATPSLDSNEKSATAS